MHWVRDMHAVRHSTQRGAALVVGLLLLLVLTLLAISGMNTASLELVMAGNTQYYQNAFQAAETGIEVAYRDAEFNPSTAEEAFVNVQISGSTTDFFTARARRQLDGTPQPALWGSSWDAFSTYHFEIESTGRSARNAVATNFQGVAVISPADQSIAPIAGSSGSTALE
ncbi:MAG TPA: PilX N-terminal domain-containing pilus assembly protein [Steroidobacteraceae bacterium]